MTPTDLQSVADTVLHLARRQGFVLSRDIRSELRIAGVPETQWKEVVALLSGSG